MKKIIITLGFLALVNISYSQETKKVFTSQAEITYPKDMEFWYNDNEIIYGKTTDKSSDFKQYLIKSTENGGDVVKITTYKGIIFYINKTEGSVKIDFGKGVISKYTK